MQWLSIAQVTNHTGGGCPVLVSLSNYIAVCYSLLRLSWPNHSSSDTPCHVEPC